jgi:ABC-2 type transport system ATP-binding protein
MLQRLGLAQALIHEPEILFLDEPTSGLDPMGRRMVRNVIRGERDRGTTIFLNSHLLSEIEVTCDRVAFIKDGAVVESRDLTLAAAATSRRVCVNVRPLSLDLLTALAPVIRTPIETDEEKGEIRFEVPTEDVIPEVVRRLVAGGANVFGLSLEATSLEDLFMRLVGEDRGL